ncbi:MAG: phosphatase PAP2 family protein [Coprothermobacterota bacterium]|nr:phosphatase PAP2 family protein [Coprothermobacterota bacterium]
MHPDLYLFQYINGLAGHFKFLDLLGIFFAEYLPYLLGLILLLLIFWPRKKRFENRLMVALGLLAALIARFVIKTVILSIFSRPRPFIILENVHKLLLTPLSENFQSFPSGHAIFFFALSMVLYRFDKKLGTWFLAASTIMGIARIFVGVHWPSDILGGAILGMITGWVVYECYQRQHERMNAMKLKLFKKG